MTELSHYIRALRGPVLVLGASGFIGANLFKCVSQLRKDVYAVVRDRKNWRLEGVNDQQIISVDLNDRTATKNLIESIHPQTVFNCVAYGAYSFESDSNLIYQTNFQSVVNLVELLLERSISAFIHAGSSSEYGTNCTAPTEDSSCEPNSPYAVSKVAIASYLNYVGKLREFPCVNLRLYSVYGPLEDTSRLMPNLVLSAQQGLWPPLVESTISRDFIHIDDVCAAFVMAATKINPELYGESFNIGTGVQTTIAELVHVAQDLFKVEKDPTFGKMKNRKWDLIDWYSNPNKAERYFQWRAGIDLKTGLISMGNWAATLKTADIERLTKQNYVSSKRSITAVVACYKDGLAIPVMHKRLTDTFVKLDVDYEIIFVNDGSPDDSASVITRLSENDPRVIGITHSRNFGSQMAFLSGMELSTKDSVVLLDGDLQDPPELIESFYNEWNRGFDVVYGRRIKRDMPWYWGILYKLFYRLFAKLSYISIPLDAGDFSLMDKRVVGWILKSPERDLFVRGLRAYLGFKQKGVDYIRPERMFGTSTNSLIKNFDWAKKGIFSYSNTPLTMLTTAGIITFALSLLIAVVVASLRIFFPEIAPKGATTLLISILIFGSGNLLAIGLVGEYVAKIMVEVKGRPKLIRSALIRNGKSTDLLPDGKSTL